jgi:hypothetical protein
MWFMALINLFNGFANNHTLILTSRITINNTPISIIDILLFIGLLMVLLRLHSPSRFPTDKTPGSLTLELILLGIACVFGVIGAAINHTETRDLLVEFRHLAAMPISILIGYHFLLTPRSSPRLVYVMVFSGVLCAFAQLFHFASTASSIGQYETLNNLRTVEYVSCYAGVAAAIILYSMLSGVRLFPFWIGLPLLLLCLVGAAAPLSRSDWVSTAAVVVAMYFIMPAKRRFKRILVGAASLPVLMVSVLLVLKLISATSDRDIEGTVRSRFEALFPSPDSTTNNRAWDSRLPSALKELELWSQSPITGRGFAIQASVERALGHNEGFHHIVWTAELAETGIIGFVAMLLVVLIPIIVGARLVKDRFDRGSVLLGAAAVAMGVYNLLLATTTMSINTSRGAIPIGIMCGAVLRCRAMELTNRRIWEGYTIENTEDFQLSDAQMEGFAEVAP